jgi:hypothetical protein
MNVGEHGTGGGGALGRGHRAGRPPHAEPPLIHDFS